MVEGTDDKREGRMIVRSDIAANVWKVEVGLGDEVAEGAVLAILESMKMEIPVEAPAPGKVVEVLIAEGQAIGEDQALFRIE
jgi:biotin carboxyl carrier protein